MTKCKHAQLYKNNPACLTLYHDALGLSTHLDEQTQLYVFPNYVGGLLSAGDALFRYSSHQGGLSIEYTENMFVSLGMFDFRVGYERFSKFKYGVDLGKHDINTYVCHVLPHIILQATGDCPYPASDFAMVSRILQLIYNPQEKEKT